jgi:hypothetical protein
VKKLIYSSTPQKIANVYQERGSSHHRGLVVVSLNYEVMFIPYGYIFHNQCRMTSLST